ncbi:MAG: glycosyltransferase family 39 protein [Candidatus Micrarchaeaceae archaeon]
MQLGGKAYKKEIWRDRRIVYALLAIIVAYDIVHSIAYTLGPTMLSEDFAYVLLAIGALHGNISFSSFYIDGTRILQYLPIALLYKLFGVNIYTSSAWNEMMFVGTVLIAFFVGKRVYSAHAGLVSALLVSFFIPAVKNSVTVGINETMMFFVSLTLLVLLYAKDRKSKWLMFATGVLALVTPLTIPIGIIAIIAVFIYVIAEFLRHELSGALIAWLFLGIVVASMPILAFSYISTGNALIIIHQNAAYYSNLSMTYTTFGILGSPPGVYANSSGNNVQSYLLFYPQQMFASGIVSSLRNAIITRNFNLAAFWRQIYKVNNNNSGFYFYAVFISALMLLMLEEKRAYFPLFWLAVGLGFLEFAPMGITLSPFRYILIFRAFRYTTSVAVPVAVIISIAVMKIAGIEGHVSIISYNKWRMKNARPLHLPRVVFAAAIVVFLIATSVPINNSWYSYVYAQTYPLHAFANYMNKLSNSTALYVPGGDYPYLYTYMYRDNVNRIIIYNSIYNCSQIPYGAYVIIPNATSGFAPQLPYVNNTGMACPNWKLVLDVNASPYIVSRSGWPKGRYEQRLYYVS